MLSELIFWFQLYITGDSEPFALIPKITRGCFYWQAHFTLAQIFLLGIRPKLQDQFHRHQPIN